MKERWMALEANLATYLRLKTKCQYQLKVSLEENGTSDVLFLDEKGKLIFGSDFSFSYSHYFETENDVLRFNIGTCGRFSPENTAQVELYRVFGIVVSDKDIQEVLKGAVLDLRNIIREYNDARKEACNE